MDDGLRVETTVLRELSAALTQVERRLEAAAWATDLSDGACGHAGLRERLAQVGAGWDRRRTETVALVAGLARSAHGAATTYEAVDAALAGLVGGRP